MGRSQEEEEKVKGAPRHVFVILHDACASGKRRKLLCSLVRVTATKPVSVTGNGYVKRIRRRQP